MVAERCLQHPAGAPSLPQAPSAGACLQLAAEKQQQRHPRSPTASDLLSCSPGTERAAPDSPCIPGCSQRDHQQGCG